MFMARWLPVPWQSPGGLHPDRRPAAGVRRRGTPVRKIQEERPLPVLPDGIDRLVGEVVGQVLGQFEMLAVVEAYRFAPVGPDELVDRVELLLRIQDVGVVLLPIEQAFHIETLVEALVVGSHLAGLPEVPFANVLHGVVAPGAQGLRDGDL